MYWEKNTPHFHAIYNEFDCKYDLPDLKILDGYLPKRANNMVIEWATLHKDESLVNWDGAIQNKSLNKIEPLK